MQTGNPSPALAQELQERTVKPAPLFSRPGAALTRAKLADSRAAKRVEVYMAKSLALKFRLVKDKVLVAIV